MISIEAESSGMFVNHGRHTALICSITALAVMLSTAVAQPPEEAAEQREEDVAAGPSVNKPEAYQGYTLVAPARSTRSYLIDMEGRVVHSWKSEYAPGAVTYFLENGHLLRASEKPDSEYGYTAGNGGRIQEFDWDGELVWEFDFDSKNRIQHHDIERLPNGNILMVVADRRTPQEWIAAGRRPEGISGPFRTDAIYEIKPTGPKSGEVVWEWHVWDHFIQDFDLEKENFGKVEEHPELININHASNNTAAARQGLGGMAVFAGAFEWSHFNAVDYNVELDQIAVSAHGFNELWIIDHSTTIEEAASHSGGRSGRGGDLLYRWGNPSAYGAGDQSDQRLFGQHDVHWIPKGVPGEGHLLVFNNGYLRPGGSTFSKVDELAPPMDEAGNYIRKAGQAFGPTELVWSYNATPPEDFYSWFISGAQRLPNGNTLICEGANGRIFEVTADKEMVWEYAVPPSSQEASVAGTGVRGGAGRLVDLIGGVIRGLGGGAGTGLLGSTLIFRAYRFGPEIPAFEGRKLTPGPPLSRFSPPSQ